MIKKESVVIMDSDITTETNILGEAVLVTEIKKEKTVTTSLLGHFRKYYNLKEAKELEEECNE